jgi:DegV family protein with EDD domain
MSGKIAILTDSTCDLPAAWVAQYEITVVPQRIVWDNHLYLDGLDLTAEAFYRRLSAAVTLPETEPPAPEDFAEVFEATQSQLDADQLVIITASNRLSRAFAHAQAGARLVTCPVFVLDSQTISMALGFIVLAAAQVCQAGGDVEDILAAARQTRRQTCLYFTVSTLDYLRRGGRISGIAHLIGTALDIKPILCIADGEIQLAENVRTQARALRRMMEMSALTIAITPETRVAITHANEETAALELEQAIRARWSPAETLVCPVSAVIGVHTGPGGLGITVSRC